MAFLTGNRLRDMIRSVRACKTAAEERAVVAKECAALRSLLKEPIQYRRHRNVAKLMFIHMLGYPTHFGQMECIKLIAEGDYPEKRIGYLGLMVLLDERQEVLLLVTNSIKNDVNHTNQHVAGLALCALGNICTAEMARDLTTEVEKLLTVNNAYIRKKAALCAVRIVRKVPELIESYKGPASNLLLEKHHGVLVAGVKLCIELCRASDSALEHFRKQVPTIVRLLKSMLLGGYNSEYDVTGISDPFLQMKLLKLLCLLGKGDSDSSDIMSDVLAEVATNTDGTRNAGKAILYECVLTIMAIEDIGVLRVLAISILGRFLASMDNNIRYVALNTLVKVVAVDNQAVQRHRAVILNCIKDSDVSIRARALELVVNLVNENNLKALTTELLEYLKASDLELKVDLAAKIAALVHKYAPTKLWYIDQIILLMVEAGKYVKEEVVWSFLAAVSNAIDLQGYTVRALYRVFHGWSGQESLAQVTVWSIGEYGDMLVNSSNELDGEDPQTVTESDAVDVVESVIHNHAVGPTTIAFSLTALLKLTARFPQCSERIQPLLEEYSRSIALELQQRSTEFGSILSRHSNIRGVLLARMPVLDLASYYAKHAGKYETRSVSPADTKRLSADPPLTELTMSHLMDMLTFQPENIPPALSDSVRDALLNILNGSPRPKSTLSSIPGRYSEGGASALLDILAVGEQTNSTSEVPQSSDVQSQRPPTLEELLADPLPDHRLSTLELQAQSSIEKPIVVDVSLRSESSAQGPPQDRSSSSLHYELLDEVSLESNRASVVGHEPSTASQQRVDTEPTLAQQERLSTNAARGPQCSSPGSLTQPPTPLLRRKSLLDDVLKSSEVLVTDSWPALTAHQLRQTKEDSTESRFRRLSFHNKKTPAQQGWSPESETSRRILLRDERKLHCSETPGGDDAWPSPAQQQKLKEDSVVRVCRMPQCDTGETSVPAQVSSRSPPFVDYPPIVAMQTQGLRVDFEFRKKPEFPQTAVIKATFTNTSSTPYTDFVVQAAVPKYMTLKLNPASSSALPQNSMSVISQVLMVTNSMHGQKPLMMKLRISYRVEGQPVLEQVQVNNFPPNL